MSREEEPVEQLRVSLELLELGRLSLSPSEGSGPKRPGGGGGATGMGTEGGGGGCRAGAAAAPGWR